MDEYEEAVLFTFALLESRLDRIEYILSGVKPAADGKPRTLAERIQRIERSLQELSKKTVLLGDVQQLCMQSISITMDGMLRRKQWPNTRI